MIRNCFDFQCSYNRYMLFVKFLLLFTVCCFAVDFLYHCVFGVAYIDCIKKSNLMYSSALSSPSVNAFKSRLDKHSTDMGTLSIAYQPINLQVQVSSYCF